MFKSLNLDKIRTYARVLADKRGTDFLNDDEINSLIEDSFDMLFLKLVQRNEAYYLKESEDMRTTNKNEIIFPDDLYKLRMVKRQDGFSHPVKEVTLQEVANLDSSYWDAYWNIPTAYGYVMFPDKIKLYPTESVSGMTFRLYYARDPLSIENESMQKGWEKFLSHKVAYKMGVIEENPRPALGDLAKEWEEEIKNFSSSRNTGIRTVTDLESTVSGERWYY